MVKIVVTGSNGMLGQTLVNKLSNDENDVYALSKGDDRNIKNSDYSYYDIDLTNFPKVTALIKKIKPDFIINTAAMTQVDACEDDKAACDLINVELVRQLADVSKNIGAHLIHISTDFIFDGENGPYKEDDQTNPVNYYGLSKLKSEEVLINSEIDYTILRTILVYGYVKGMHRSNFVLWILDALKNKKTVTVVDDQFRMPTLVDDLAHAVILAIQKRAKGVFNVSSSKLLSIYNMAIEIAETFSLNKNYIKRIATSELNQRAKRPKITGFDLSKSKKELNLPQYSFKERLQLFKDQLDK